MKTVILAGGTGTRLWPLSRKNKPKQFHSLVSEDSLLIETVKRLSFQKPEDIFIATTKEYLQQILEQTAEFIPATNIIVEPAMMDTAPCIGLIASILHRIDPQSVMAVIYADHLIQDQEELIQKLKVAEKIAVSDNSINIIEVKANFPSVHLGYVKIGQQIANIDGIRLHAFEKFIEKPDLQTAKHFLKHQSYLWNTGLYVMSTKTILEKFQTHLPKTSQILNKIADSWQTDQFEKTLQELYPQTDKISIDYGIMEKLQPQEVKIIPADLGWSDIGTWESLWDELNSEQINNGNVVKGQYQGLNSSNNLIYGNNQKLIATIGLEDFVIVDTPDALLVCPKNRSHQLKELLSELKKSRPDLL